jgi:glycerol-3-phosphate dehydrogenase (NAD(P)+)
MAKVAVVGAGMMGTALCTPIADAGHDVFLVGTHLDEDLVRAMKRDRVHPKLGLGIAPTVKPLFLEELDEALDGASFLGLGVSSAGVRWAAELLGSRLLPDTPVIMVSKGLEESSSGQLRILPDVFSDALPEAIRGRVSPCAIAGPCIAGEIARKVPTAVVFTGRNKAILHRFAEAFSTSYYHIQVSTDVVGVEVCAALKNAYAMAVGIGAGVHESLGGTKAPVAHHNYEAAVFAQACIEMDRLVRALGGDPQHIPHLAGAGDLFVTTSGGRSSRLGRWLGLGLTFQEAQEKMRGDTLESAEIIRILGEALPAMNKNGTLSSDSLPLMNHLYDVIVGNQKVNMPFHRFFSFD